jgi:hypothetical protein
MSGISFLMPTKRNMQTRRNSFSITRFRCENCQFEIDRDLNAAINIKQITFGQHAAQTACLDSSAIEISTFGTKENHACGDTNTGEEIRSSSRHVSLKQEKGEARSSGSFGLEAYASLARR